MQEKNKMTNPAAEYVSPLGWLMGRASEGLLQINPASLVDMWIDSAGYHFVDRRQQYQLEAHFGWDAKFEEVLPHTQALWGNQMYSTIFEEGRASRIAGNVQNNARAFEARLRERLGEPQ